MIKPIQRLAEEVNGFQRAMRLSAVGTVTVRHYRHPVPRARVLSYSQHHTALASDIAGLQSGSSTIMKLQARSWQLNFEARYDCSIATAADLN